MGFLSKLFGQADQGYSLVDERPDILQCCVNETLMPRWRGPEVMEDDQNALGFVCQKCGREFGHDRVHDRRVIAS
jgi:hypothetical protein